MKFNIVLAVVLCLMAFALGVNAANNQVKVDLVAVEESGLVESGVSADAPMINSAVVEVAEDAGLLAVTSMAKNEGLRSSSGTTFGKEFATQCITAFISANGLDRNYLCRCKLQLASGGRQILNCPFVINSINSNASIAS